jgi:hypothetical protein
MPVIVKAMKCHPSDPLVQEHGNVALYNLLPLILCAPDSRSDIDRKRYREISALIPSLPAVVLRGMEQNPTNLSVQQFGLLVLNRICKKDQNTYEVFVSEGGLTILMNNLKLTTTKAFDGSEDDSGNVDVDGDDHGQDWSARAAEMKEKRDCLAQLASQFVRDLSRPTNSSMDIVRAIAIKGGVTALLHLLEYYNSEVLTGTSSTGAINIVDPAMACLRNLFCNTENILQVMADDHDNLRVIPTVLHTMDCFSLDAAVQAYGCDVLGRLGQIEAARREITNTAMVAVSIRNGSSASPYQPGSQVDVMVSALRAMRNHRSHAGVQERAVVLLWVLIVHDTKHSSSLISRLREVHNDEQPQRDGNDFIMKDLVSFLRQADVTPRGADRLRELVYVIEQYEQGKTPVLGKGLPPPPPPQEKENGRVNFRNLVKNSWIKLKGEQTECPSSPGVYCATSTKIA